MPKFKIPFSFEVGGEIEITAKSVEGASYLAREYAVFQLLRTSCICKSGTVRIDMSAITEIKNDDNKQNEA